jgi:hypothetical protein
MTPLEISRAGNVPTGQHLPQFGSSKPPSGENLSSTVVFLHRPVEWPSTLPTPCTARVFRKRGGIVFIELIELRVS